MIATQDLAPGQEGSEEISSDAPGTEIPHDAPEPPSQDVPARSRILEQETTPAQKPPWPEEDSGGGNWSLTTQESSGSGSGGNFSEAFNVKHLIYFENSSQNNG